MTKSLDTCFLIFRLNRVHVANGLIRGLTNRTYETEPAQRLLRRYVRNQRLGIDEDRFSNQILLEAYPQIFQLQSGDNSNDEHLTRAAGSRPRRFRGGRCSVFERTILIYALE